MSYRHEVVATVESTVEMSHYRVTETPSGLVALTEIARSIVLPTETRRSTQGLAIANAVDARFMGIHSGETDESRQVVDSIDCDNLDEFTRRGEQRWQELIEGMGKAVFRIALAEEVHITEQMSAGGLIIPSEHPDREFVGYYANPDEIEALEVMGQNLRLKLGQADTEPVPGLYI